MSDPWLALAKAAAKSLPGIKCELGRFAKLLEQRTAAARAPLNAADLLLAQAALEGDPAALAELDRRLVRCVRAMAGKFEALAVDELEQQVRQRVLVGDGGSGPRLQ